MLSVPKAPIPGALVMLGNRDISLGLGVRNTPAFVHLLRDPCQQLPPYAGIPPNNPLDAMIGGYYEGDKLMFASKVRTGFVPRLRHEVWQKLKVFEIAACPFGNLPGRSELSFSAAVKK